MNPKIKDNLQIFVVAVVFVVSRKASIKLANRFWTPKPQVNGDLTAKS